MRKIDYREYVTFEHRHRVKIPYVRDLNIKVNDVLYWLSKGKSFTQIVNRFPELTITDLEACLAYAEDHYQQQ